MNQRQSQRACLTTLALAQLLVACSGEVPTTASPLRPAISLNVSVLQFLPEEYEETLWIPDDGDDIPDQVAWRCPDDRRSPPTSRPARLGVLIGNPPDDHVVTFVFDGPKPFLRYAGFHGVWPIGEFGIPTTLSEDYQWAAHGPLRMACRGRYFRLPGGLFWTGSFLTLGVASVVPANLPPQNGPPGSGGGDPPSEPNEPHCAWYRDFVVYSDGSWDWWGGWYWECEGGGAATLRSSSRHTTATYDLRSIGFGRRNPLTAAFTYRVTPKQVLLLGVDGLPNGRMVEVRWTKEGSADAAVVIDLQRASPADLEAALFLIEQSEKGPAAGVLGSIAGPPTPFITSRTTGSSRAAQAMSALLVAPPGPPHTGRSTRQLMITVSRPGTRMHGLP